MVFCFFTWLADSADFFRVERLVFQGLREGWQWSSFFFSNCHGFGPVAIDKEKKRERTARPLWSRPKFIVLSHLSLFRLF
ncbi:hypothetical protein D3C84_44910 [compost metagenome]